MSNAQAQQQIENQIDSSEPQSLLQQIIFVMGVIVALSIIAVIGFAYVRQHSSIAVMALHFKPRLASSNTHIQLKQPFVAGVLQQSKKMTVAGPSLQLKPKLVSSNTHIQLKQPSVAGISLQSKKTAVAGPSLQLKPKFVNSNTHIQLKQANVVGPSLQLKPKLTHLSTVIHMKIKDQT